MIKHGRLKCDGCGEPGPETDPDYPRPDWEYLERDAGERGWLIQDGSPRRPGRHYCRTCRLAIERDSLVPAAKGGAS